MDREFHVTYPDHGGIWFEKKVIMSSVIRGLHDGPDIAQDIASHLMEKKGYDFRLLNHPIGIDVVPPDWSKRKAAEDFSQDVSSDIFWFVYGDNESDKEMLDGVGQGEYVDARKGASEKVKEHLLSLELKKIVG